MVIMEDGSFITNPIVTVLSDKVTNQQERQLPLSPIQCLVYSDSRLIFCYIHVQYVWISKLERHNNKWDGVAYIEET